MKEIPNSIFDTKLISVNTYSIELNRPYLVKGLLLAKQVSIFAGPSNLGKSAITACLASHIVLGRNFGEMKVRQSAVLYVAAEDPLGIADRAYPFMQQPDSETAPFNILGRPIDLSNRSEMDLFQKSAKEYLESSGYENLLIVFDTLNLCIGDGDENSARDMGKVIGNAQKLAHETGAHVMIIHHTGTSGSSRPRGSSALTANVDTLLTLHRADTSQPNGTVFIGQEKQRGIPKGDAIAFKIKSFHVGFDSDNDPVSVPMAEPFKPQTALAVVPLNKTKRRTDTLVTCSPKTPPE